MEVEAASTWMTAPRRGRGSSAIRLDSRRPPGLIAQRMERTKVVATKRQNSLQCADREVPFPCHLTSRPKSRAQHTFVKCPSPHEASWMVN
ncbi:hypothetical protein CMUS01_15806 [Colletotrichum musicola]|uniref:Uncharacterized protein n=1 Tax=Colletotrichum musicola TaxID=2175873 RepID=A0A8H6ITC4_9PEZI|nr:hypothetical protein CMUS01_15806 [Colletotrichum musicola]